MYRRLFLLLGALALAALAAGAWWLTGRPVVVRADGQTRQLETHAATVAGLLREAGLTLDPADRVWLGDALVQTPLPTLETEFSSGAVVVVERANRVWLWVDGQARQVRTRATVPRAILASASVALNPDDEVWVDGRLVPADEPLAAPPAALRVRRAAAITVAENGVTRTIQTAAQTVGEAVWRAGLRLYAADRLEPPAETPLRPGAAIVVDRAPVWTIQADGRTLSLRARAATVGAVLAQAGLPLAGGDYSLPAAADPPPADGQIRVVRVREQVLVEQTVIPRETSYQALPDVDLDTVQTLQAGADGLRRRLVRVRFEDGVEVSRVTEAEAEAQAAEARVIGYGARITLRTVDTPDGILEYWRSYTAYATSYSPSRAGVPRTARNFGITASGRPLVKGLVAVDRRYIPFGTRMYIPGYGFALAADTGGGVKGRWIDLGYEDDNYQHWSQVVTVYFLTPVPPADQIRWIIPETVP